MRIIVAIVLTAFLFLGCKSPNSTSGKTYGNLSLNSALTTTSTKSLKRDLSSGTTCWPTGVSTSDGFTYCLSLTNSNTTTTKSNTTGSFTIDNLLVGSWSAKVTVTAGTTEVASVTQTLTITSGATTSLSLTPVPADGSGTVTLDWSWPSTASLTPSLVFTPLVSASGTTTTEGSSSIASGTQESFTLKTGLYSVTALLTNASGKVSWGTQDTLLVLNGSTTDLGTLTVANSTLNLAPGAPTVGTPDWNSTGSQIAFTLAAASTNGSTTGYPETYSIYRSTSLLSSDSSTWGAAIATLGDTVTGYTDTTSLDKTATYYYKVTASNSFGSASSVSEVSTWNNSASLGFAVSPLSVYTVSISNSTILGSTALYYNKSTTFAAAYTGSAAAYQWYWDGASITGAASSTVTLKATASDSLYTSGNHVLMVKITDTNGVSFSGYSTLTVQYLTIPSQGLVGEWLLNGTIADTSGQGLSSGTVTVGTISYTTDENGTSNSAVSFDGATTLDLGQSSVLHFSPLGSFSISFWLNANSLAGYPLYQTNPSGYSLGYFVQAGSGSLTVGSTECNVGNYQVSYAANTSQWYHVVLTYNTSGETFYLNGNNVASTTSVPDSYCISTPSSGSLCLGNSSFSGKVSKLRVYNRLLTASEVLGLSYE